MIDETCMGLLGWLGWALLSWVGLGGEKACLSVRTLYNRGMHTANVTATASYLSVRLPPSHKTKKQASNKGEEPTGRKKNNYIPPIYDQDK